MQSIRALNNRATPSLTALWCAQRRGDAAAHRRWVDYRLVIERQTCGSGPPLSAPWEPSPYRDRDQHRHRALLWDGKTGKQAFDFT